MTIVEIHAFAKDRSFARCHGIADGSRKCCQYREAVDTRGLNKSFGKHR